MSESELNRLIVKQISYYLNVSGKSQFQLAEYTGVTQATVSNWCNAIKIPRMDKIDKLCAYFNIQRSDLLTDNPLSMTSPTSATSVRIPVLGLIAAGIPL